MALKDRPIEGGHLWPVIPVSGRGSPDPGANGPMYVSEAWTVTSTKDEVANDTDKSFGVPAGQEWQILFIRVVLVTTATVGTRQLALEVHDATNDTIFEVIPGVTQAASLTYNYNFGAGMMDLTAVRDTTFVSSPFPSGLILQALNSIRVYDNNAIDANDDISVYIQYAYRYV